MLLLLPHSRCFVRPPWLLRWFLRRTPIQHCTSCRPPIFKANIPFEFFLQDLNSFTKILNVNGKADSRTKCRMAWWEASWDRVGEDGNGWGKIDLQSVPCSFWTVILHSDFEMFFNYPSPTYGPRYANVSSFGRAHRIVFESWSWSRRRTHTQG